ncbi:MAG: hypothetical protein EB006_11650 [Betaproteobacteria bacterium]|nr:hypothetical protein [Betaproteobacteria bacterium]
MSAHIGDGWTHWFARGRATIFTWASMQRRFQRQGVLGALVLHLAFPVALTASQWWPLIANQQVADGGREHDRDHEAANEDSKQDEMASLKTFSQTSGVCSLSALRKQKSSGARLAHSPLSPVWGPACRCRPRI